MSSGCAAIIEGEANAQPMPQAVLHQGSCNMTAPDGTVLAYNFSEMTDFSATGSCSANGRQATFASPATACCMTSANCQVSVGAATYYFWDSFQPGGAPVRPRAMYCADAACSTWKVYVFGGAVDLTNCGTDATHCVAAGACTP